MFREIGKFVPVRFRQSCQYSDSLDHRTTLSHVVKREARVDRIPLNVQIFEAWEVLEHADVCDHVVGEIQFFEIGKSRKAS